MASAAERSWSSWWTNDASTVRVQNARDNRGGCESDADDEFVGPNGKMARRTDDGIGYWEDDPAKTVIASPLDLSMKATVTTTTTTQQRATDGRSELGGNVYATPVKKKSATKSSSKKNASKAAATAAAGIRSSAVKAVTRKLLPQLMMDRTSPVSGTIITTMATGATAADDRGGDDDYEGDDIDPEYNIVVATEDARRRLESIPNVLGPYRCRLCGVRYADAFALARHRCRCIVHVRYQCPECDKVFQCPANLASHRRWHGAGSVKTAGPPDRKPDAACNNNNNNDDDDDVTADGGDPIAGNGARPVSGVTTAAGFKKNILQRAVQAAAAAGGIDDAAGVCA